MSASNIKVRSNVMIASLARGNEMKYVPGDYAKQIYPEVYFDKRAMGMYFTQQQMIEIEQTLVCIKCKRPCAGTCSV